MESSIQETEDLRGKATSVSLENSALEGKLQGLRQEKEQLRAELKDKMEELHTQVGMRGRISTESFEQRRKKPNN